LVIKEKFEIKSYKYSLWMNKKLPNKVDQIETLSKEGSSSSKDTFVYGYL
jgi:hypothetical protein